MARAETATVADRYRVWVGTTVLRITVRFGRLRARAARCGAVVLCVDEKSTIQALNRFLPTLSMMPAALVSTSSGPAQARNSLKNLSNP